MLQHKNAVIYGAGGSLGGAVAKALAAAGAKVFLTGRTISTVQKVANEIIAAGGFVTVDVTCGTTAALNYRVDAARDEREGKVLAS